MSVTRRGIITAGSVLTGVGLINLPVFAGVAPSPVATTANGKVCGGAERGVNVFRSIPYGGCVSSPFNRFKAPPPAPSWTGIREATAYGPASLQASAPGPTVLGDRPPAEDCLTLNVWTPAADGRKRPVMFYSHGGGFSSNSGNSVWVNGANLARLNDVVVVTHNHLLGLMGYRLMRYRRRSMTQPQLG